MYMYALHIYAHIFIYMYIYGSMHASQLPLGEKEPPPLKSEVEKAMNRISSNKAPGPDNVPIELMRAGGAKTLDILHRICVNVWETGDWPEEWRSSVFIPLPKKGDLS